MAPGVVISPHWRTRSQSAMMKPRGNNRKTGARKTSIDDGGVTSKSTLESGSFKQGSPLDNAGQQGSIRQIRGKRLFTSPIKTPQCTIKLRRTDAIQKPPANAGEGSGDKNELEEDERKKFVTSDPVQESDDNQSLNTYVKRYDFLPEQEQTLAEWFQQHPEFYQKEHDGYKDSEHKEHIMEEKAASLKSPCTCKHML